MTKRNRWLAIIIALCTMCLFMTGCAEVDEGNHESRDIVDDEIEEASEQVTENVTNEGTRNENITIEDGSKIPALVFLESYKIDVDSSKNFYQFIFYDPETLIMYSYVEWVDGGGFVEMHNPDGTPRLYKK